LRASQNYAIITANSKKEKDMRIIALSLAALILASPAFAQRGGSRIIGRSATTARSGTMVTSGGDAVKNYNNARDRADATRSSMFGAGNAYQTEADLIWRYDTSDASLKAARDALDRAYKAFVDSCVNPPANNINTTCEKLANEIKTNRDVKGQSWFDSANPLYNDLFEAARHHERVQIEYDKVRADMGLVGDAIKAEIDEGLKAFRSAYNRARSMCNDGAALDAIKSANGFVAATLALQGVGVVGSALGANKVGEGWTAPDGCTDDCKDKAGQTCRIKACLESQESHGKARHVAGNVVGAVGNLGATITSFVARDAFMKAIYRLDDCQAAAVKIFDIMKNVDCPSGFSAEEVDDGTGKMVPTGKCAADNAVNKTCPFGWTFNVLTSVCETSAVDLAGQTVPTPACPTGTTAITTGPDAGKCSPMSVNRADVTSISQGIHRIWQGSKAKDSVEACLDVKTGTGKFGNQQSDRWQLAWASYISNGGAVSLSVMADNMLYSAVGTSVAAALNVGGAMGKGAGWGVGSTVLGSLSAVGFTVPVLMASSEMLYRAEKCLSAWPETADEQW